MNRSLKRFVTGMLTLGCLLPVAGAWAATLNVYSVKPPPSPTPITPANYIGGSPYIYWDPARINANRNSWLSADEFLVIETDLLYNKTCAQAQGHLDGSCDVTTPQPCSGGNCWAIQIFTDNTAVANAGGASYNLPDTLDAGNNIVPGGTGSGVYRATYSGFQTIQKSGQNLVPKSGLISDNGLESLPLIWHVYDALPAGRVPTITETPIGVGGSLCDFNWGNPTDACGWFYMKDKGDQILPAGGGSPQPSWTDGIDYVTPLNQYGTQTNVNKRFKPDGFPANGRNTTNTCDTSQAGCTTNQYIYLGSNFRNGTRQVYSTTVFVELLTF